MGLKRRSVWKRLLHRDALTSVCGSLLMLGQTAAQAGLRYGGRALAAQSVQF
jgi:hypothetical protein